MTGDHARATRVGLQLQQHRTLSHLPAARTRRRTVPGGPPPHPVAPTTGSLG